MYFVVGRFKIKIKGVEERRQLTNQSYRKKFRKSGKLLERVWQKSYP